MTIGGIGSSNSYLSTALLNLRRELDDLQKQLATGKKSGTYAGMGTGRAFGMSLRAQLSSLASFGDSITNANLRINIANSVLDRMNKVGTDVRSAAANGPVQLDNAGQTSAQKTAQLSLAEMVDLLNTQAGDRYLFSGRAIDQRAVVSLSDMMDGTGSKAGLKQLIAERQQADLGDSGLGRVVVSSPGATSVGVAEDAIGSPFGLKLNGLTSVLTGATVTGPSGSPPSLSIDLGATNPSEGDSLRLTFSLPDGSTETVELTATTKTPPPAGSFGIGADTTATATNLKNALTTAVGTLANTALVAASALQASDNFFNSSPPLRVGTSPFTAATTLVAGTTTDTVSWYTGEAGSDPARGTSVARADQTITVQYGMRAEEQGFRWQLQNIAAFAAVTISPANPNANALVNALNQRMSQNLSPQSGQQSIEDIQAELAGAQVALKAAQNRQAQTKTMLQTMLDQSEGVSDEEVASKILALQTNLQASYQTTSMLYQLSLTDYI